MGGLTKEWFLLLCKKIFDVDYGMFNYNKESGTYWFNTVEFENYQEYNLVGVLMGLAVYNSTILDIRYDFMHRLIAVSSILPNHSWQLISYTAEMISQL